VRTPESSPSACADRALAYTGLRDEQGGVLIIAGFALLMLISVVALLLDLGRLYSARNILQLRADMAALSAAHVVGACTPTPEEPIDAAGPTALANGFAASLSSSPNQVEYGVIANQAGLRVFSATADLAQAEAVRVSLVETLPVSLVLPSAFTGDVDLAATSVARVLAAAEISGGTRFTSAQTQSPTTVAVLDDVLGGLIGTAPSLGAVAYDGLYSTDVPLQGMADEAGAGTGLRAFLDQDLTLAQFFQILSDTLVTQGQPDAAASVDAISAATTTSQTFTVGDFIAVESGSEDRANDASISALDLVLLSAQSANVGQTIVVDPISITLSGVSSSSMRFRILEAAQYAVGPPGRDSDGNWRTQLQTSQVRLEVSLTAADLLTTIGSEPVTLTSYMSVAPATVSLNTIDCRRSGDAATQVVVEAEAGAATAGLGVYSDIANSSGVDSSVAAELSVLGVPVARVRVGSDVPFAASSESLTFDGPFVPWIDEPAASHTKTVSSDLPTALDSMVTSLALSPNITVEVLGTLPLGVSASDISDDSEAVILPLIDQLDDVYGTTLQALTGSIGGVDVTVHWVGATRPRLMR